MIRKRLAVLAAAAGLGLLSGCSSPTMTCCNRPSFFGRLTGRMRTVEVVPVESGGAPCCDGPMLMDRGPVVMPSVPAMPGVSGVPGMPPVPGSAPCAPGGVPGGAPLAPVPRLVPEPQAQARPYYP